MEENNHNQEKDLLKEQEIYDSNESEHFSPVIFQDPNEYKQDLKVYEEAFIEEKIKNSNEFKKYSFNNLPSELSTKIRNFFLICIAILISIIFLTQNFVLFSIATPILLFACFLYVKIIIATLNSKNFHSHKVLITSVENNVLRKLISINADYVFYATEFLPDSTKEVVLTSKNKTDYLPGRVYEVYFTHSGSYLFKKDITNEYNI